MSRRRRQFYATGWCPTATKQRFPTKVSAKTALTILQETRRTSHVEQRTHQCQCGCWHLTSRPEGVV